MVREDLAIPGSKDMHPEQRHDTRWSRFNALWQKHRGLLTLVGLGAFAVSQPVLSDLRAGAGYFVARRTEPLEIVLLVLAITLAPGVAAGLLAWLAGRLSKKIGAWVQAGLVGTLVALLAQALSVRITDASWNVLVGPAIAIGAVSAVVYHRSNWVRDAFVWLVPAPVIVAGFFLFTPPVVHLVVPPSVTAVETNVDREAPVVFIVFDEMPVVSLLNREGEIDANRYPNFAALGEISTWFKYTATSHDNTLWAVPSLLTGSVPDPSRLPTTNDYPGNLFTFLDGSHEMHVEEPFTFLCPDDMCRGDEPPTTFPERFDRLIVDAARLYSMLIAHAPSQSASVEDPFNEFLQDTGQTIGAEASADQAARFDEFLKGITSADSTLHFAHVFLPHVPYRYYPSGRQYLGGGRLDGLENETWVEDASAEQAYQRHLLQVEYVDDLIGDLVSRLEEVGILDESILVVTADHGASFRVNSPRRGIEDGNAYEVGMVPLFIKAPHQSSGVVDTTPARTIDVLPTVAQFLGVDLPWLHEGQALNGSLRGQAPLEVQAVGGGQVALDSVIEGLFNASEYAYSLFGDGSGRYDPFLLGDYDDLIGSAPDEVLTGSSNLDVRVEDLWRLAHVTTSANFVPGYLNGEISGDVAPNSHLAIALNGRIRTVVPVRDVNGLASFSAIVPDHAFVNGFNELELMALSGPAQSPEVERIRVDGQHRIELKPGDSDEPERLIDDDGHRWVVTDEPVMNGYVDATEWYPTGALDSSMRDLVVVGWAVDKLQVQPAERVAFFVDGVFAGSAVPDVERPDIERAYEDPGALVTGFRGQVSHFSPTESCDLRVFALSGDNAVELEVSERAQSTFLGC